MSEYDIAAYANGYATGHGYGHTLIDQDTYRKNSTLCALTEEEMETAALTNTDDFTIREDWGHWLVCDMSEG
jgi:hypothetical protein